jgi:hypothetical protein
MKRAAVMLLAMHVSACVPGCQVSVPLTEEQSAVLSAVSEAAHYKDRSVPENVAAIPRMRALLPPDAEYHPYPALQLKDSWVVSDSLSEVVMWYRQTMAAEGFEPTLRQCTDGSIWGGKVLIVDYCSATHYAELRLGEDTANRVTSIELQYTEREPALDCRTLIPTDTREKWTEGCPAELLP